MSDLAKRLRIKAGMIEMGERIAWGSDSALMREAADALEATERGAREDYKLVPVEPTPEMVEAAKDAYMPFGDMDLAVRMAILAAPAVQGDPVAYMFSDDWGRTKIVLGKETAEHWCPPGEKIEPLYTAPQPAEQQPDVAQLVEALEQIERWDAFPSTDKTWEGSGEPVSYGAAFGSNGERDFMRDVARKALAAHRKQQEGEA